MIKTILKISFVSLLMTGICVPMMAEPSPEGIEAEAGEVQITQSQSTATVRVTNGQGKVLEVFNVAGVPVCKMKIDSNDKRIDLNIQKGCYILKVGKVVRKISVK